jgi:hypothetical protein
MMNDSITPTSLYLDWRFWSAIAAWVALAASLLPKIWDRLRGPKLSIELHDRIQITHTVGNPNASVFVMLRNIGARPLRIRSMDLRVIPREGQPFDMRGLSYVEKPSTADRNFFAPLKLRPNDDDWSHIVLFHVPLSRTEEQEHRRLVGANRENILAKRALLDPPNDPQQFVNADPEFVQPAIDFLRRKFIWDPGEYEFILTVSTEPARLTQTCTFRVTLYETDSDGLRRYADDYKFGLGLWYFNLDKHPGAWVGIVL